jgi:hypothetical protein
MGYWALGNMEMSHSLFSRSLQPAACSLSFTIISATWQRLQQALTLVEARLSVGKPASCVNVTGRGSGCKNFRQVSICETRAVFLQGVLSYVRPKAPRKAFSGISPIRECRAVLSLHPVLVIKIDTVPKGPSTEALGTSGLKRLPGKGLEAQQPRKGHVSCISTQRFSRDASKKFLPR